MTSCRPTKLASDERPAGAVANEQIRRIVDRYHPMIRFDGVGGEVSTCFLASGQHVHHTLDGIGTNWRAAKVKVDTLDIPVFPSRPMSQPRRKQERTAHKFLTSLIPPLSHFAYV